MLRITLALFLMSATPTCNRCIGIGSGCADPFYFKLVDNSTGKDLVFNSNPAYHRDSVQLFTNRPGNSGRNLSLIDKERFMSSLAVAVDTFYLKLSATDTDTLLMQYNYVKDKCCSTGQFGKIATIKYNGTLTQQEADAFIFRK